MSNGIKTTKRNQIFIVQKRVGSRWQMITDAIFRHRASARECSNSLNALASVTGRGPNRRYRVAIMRVVESHGSVDTTATTVGV